VFKTERFADGNLIDSCTEIPTADTVIVNQWYNVYGKMWKQTNSPFQPKSNYYILKTYKKNMVGQTYEYHYNCVGMVDTIFYHYWEKYKYDTLGRQIEIVKTNGGVDSTKINFTYNKLDIVLEKIVTEYSNEGVTIKYFGYTIDKEGKIEEQLLNTIITKNKK